MYNHLFFLRGTWISQSFCTNILRQEMQDNKHTQDRCPQVCLFTLHAIKKLQTTQMKF